MLGFPDPPISGEVGGSGRMGGRRRGLRARGGEGWREQRIEGIEQRTVSAHRSRFVGA